jgi:hypothetical protein
MGHGMKPYQKVSFGQKKPDFWVFKPALRFEVANGRGADAHSTFRNGAGLAMRIERTH